MSTFISSDYVTGLAVLFFGLLSALLMSAVTSGIEAPDVEWIRTFGNPAKESTELGNAVQQTTDGGFIIAGTGPGLSSSFDIYLIKTNASGQEVWRRTFGGNQMDRGFSVQQTTDGGYVIVGDTSSYGAGEDDVWLIKTNPLGNKVWDKTFGGTDDDYGFCVHQTTDGGFVIVGGTLSFGNQPEVGGVAEVYLIKTDAYGNEFWEKTFGGNEVDIGDFVRQTTDGGYVIVGTTESGGDDDIYLIKADASGNKLWEKTYGRPFLDEGKCVQQTSDGGYVIVGNTALEDSESWEVFDVYLIKTDALGNKLWEKTFGGDDAEGSSYVEQTSDGGYVIIGGTASYSADGGDFWFIKTDALGNKVWDRTVDVPRMGGANCGQQTSDEGYIAVGTSFMTPEYTYADIQLVKLKPGEAPVSEAVYFPDPNLEQAIREAINKPTGDIYESDLVGLTQLDASNRGILDLTGLENCTNLETLDLYGNQISDISPISSLTHIRALTLAGNQIRDIAPLSRLTILRDLHLGANQIRDITPLASLTNLESLLLYGNRISDISSLRRLINLKLLILWSNQISSISQLEDLVNLQELSLAFNQITDISPLSSLSRLANLWNLQLQGNQIRDIRPLSRLVALKALSLENNKITDIQALVDNPGLGSGDEVDIRNNYLDLTPGSDDMQNIQALINRGVDVEYEPQNADTPSGRVDLVSVTPACGNTLQRGTHVRFEVTVSYELQGVETGRVSAELGLPNGRGVGIGSHDVGRGSGRATIIGTVDVDHLHEWLQEDATYKGTAYLAISVGERVDSSTWHALEWEHLPDCPYPIVSPVEGKIPVLLVHGFQRKGGFDPLDRWKKMAEFLTGNSITKASQVTYRHHTFWKLEGVNVDKFTVYISNYSHDTSSPTYCDIRLYASYLAEEIEGITSFEGVDKIDIVAHSMGGLVARAYIENSDFPSNPYGTSYQHDVRRLVMLGTPNHGVPLAVWSDLLGKSATSEIAPQQMIPNSSFLNVLNHGCTQCQTGEDLIPQEVGYSVIAGNIDRCNPFMADIRNALFCHVAGYGEHDRLVSTESAKLNGVNFDTCAVDHWALPNVSQVCRKVDSILRETGILIDQAYSITYACPVNVVIVDEFGRQVSDRGVNEIPEAFISIDAANDVITIYLPLYLKYSVRIAAYESGSFTLIEKLPSANNTTIIHLFSNISVTNKTTAVLEILPDTEIDRVMTIDRNGDGIIDEESQSVVIIVQNGKARAQCTYNISPTSKTFDQAGGTGTVSVTTQSGCTWTAQSNNSWITITSGSSGTGSGTLSYRVDACTGSGTRTGTMTIAGKTFTVTQTCALPPPSGLTHIYDSKAGWYMVSVPLNSGTASALFGTTAYRWNPVTKQYAVVSTIEPTKGYWVNLPADKTVTDRGGQVTTDVTIDVSTVGWHMISAPWLYHKVAIHVVRGTEIKSWPEAVEAGWVREEIYHYKPTYWSYWTPGSLYHGTATG